MLSAIATHQSPLTLDDVTPIARLTGEYEVIAVPASSPFRTLSDFIATFRQRPEAISWSGGSAGGGDQILAGLVAVAVGVPAARVNYVAFSGGGESVAALIGGQVSVGVSGLAEFAPHIEAGTVRALAISSATRVAGLDLPTLRELGVDVEFENWRSLVAPPGIGAGDRERLEALVADMVRSREWREALARYRWLDRYLPRQEFTAFVSAERVRVERILREFGRARTATPLTSNRTYPLLVLAGLFAAAIVMVWQSRRRAVTAVATGGSAGWRPVMLVAAGIVMNLVLAERAGFVLASALLFWCTARAFDPGRPIRDAVLALLIAIGVYVLFARVLQLPLPAGPLARLL
jgi:tripartite-type tricarboxylate transporter receptor subunit TctC